MIGEAPFRINLEGDTRRPTWWAKMMEGDATQVQTAGPNLNANGEIEIWGRDGTVLLTTDDTNDKITFPKVNATALEIGGVAMTATAAELSKLAGVVAGTVSASKAIVVDANKKIDVLDIATDGLTVNLIKVDPFKYITIFFRAAGDLVDQHVFIADRAYQVVSVKEIHSTVSTSGTMLPRKITDTSAPGAGTGATVKDLIQAALNTNTAINTTQTGTLSATPADLQLAANDKISIKTGGTTTGLAGCVLVIALKPI